MRQYGTGPWPLEVPRAVTVVVLEFSHVTDATPTLSDAVPANVMVDAEVETLVNVGEAIAIEGGEVADRALFCVVRHFFLAL